MKKNEFIEKLCRGLRFLPADEAQRTALFYSEAIDDRIEDGMDEEAAVAAMGSIDDICKEIEQNLPLTAIVKQRVRESHDTASNKGIWVALAIIGFPVWLPLLIALFAVVFSVYAVIWSVIIAVVATVLAILLAGVAIIIGCILLPYVIFPPRLILLGAGLVCIAISILIFPAIRLFVKWLASLTVKFIKAVKRLFIRKRRAE